MRIRLTDGPCRGDHDVRLSATASPPEEYLVLVEKGKRTVVNEIYGGAIPRVKGVAVHRPAKHHPEGTPVYRSLGRGAARA